MDNAYYTGATLIRTGNSNGGGNNSHQSKYASFPGLRTAGSPPISSCGIHHGTPPPPIVLQPNLLTGLPLIRNAQHLQPHLQPSANGHQHGPNGSTQGQGTPPGVICCFQPIYYIPAPSQPQTAYNPPILLPASTNKQNVHNNGNFQHQQCIGKQVAEVPKRKNYKSLTLRHTKLKPVQSSPPPLTSGGIQEDRDHYQNHASYQHSKLTATASFPDPISPPAKLAHQVLTRTTSTNFFATTDTDYSNEEKQRNDKMLNFYFYEKHWRPREEENRNNSWTDAGSSQKRTKDKEDQSWDVIQRPTLQKTLSASSEHQTTNTAGFDRQPGAGRLLSSSPPTILKQQQKDLEVEAQIITLANGHRDLEIRLCYVTSWVRGDNWIKYFILKWFQIT